MKKESSTQIVVNCGWDCTLRHVFMVNIYYFQQKITNRHKNVSHHKVKHKFTGTGKLIGLLHPEPVRFRNAEISYINRRPLSKLQALKTFTPKFSTLF